MRVLLVLEYPTLNGGERSLLTVLPELIRRKIQFQAVAPARGELAKCLRDLAIDVFDFEAPSGIGDRRNWRLERLAEAIAQFEPNLVHGNSLSMGRLLGPFGKSHHLPTVSHVRDIMKLSQSAMGDVNQNAKLIAVSDATRQCFVNGFAECRN